ncbi:2-amino-4-hydroxy-6-hydroxymethyldihydropteridine diphosphokinase [Friedmanniella endophytica]|uniref:2-amino-4-hydroxy-6-hydroxymethyldihydropteridine diphosphokinase n=1 Tax=Microlunatus kandeliicorticis TaxID=1759536 RepID=A0A7W3IPA1_9ACTN|nr:2-amino-4-hydroxy-6-hydroxymethyldihydropteridine diphosphokinase [Microlunatus kandeliicorticis]MBA8792724.1 2-amino-4-hydroxy-6-hydroxymethyldihydropteridine diphosphokinase [Microlunatus kandeliicorticis]
MSTSPNPYAIDADTLSGMKPLRKVVYSVGSNLGDRLANLQGAVDAIRDTPDVIVVEVSSVYETEPVGGPADSPKFLNLVILAETTLEPRTLLERALAVEDAFGRERTEHWGPRTLDVDLVVVGTTQTDQPDLKLPHPQAHARAFVLAPWVEVDPEAELPGRGRIADLLGQADLSGIVRRDDLVIDND